MNWTWWGRTHSRGRLAILLSLVSASGGCQADATSAPDPPDDPEANTGSWVFHTPFDWTHDGNPHPGTYVTVYSDAASDQMKRHLAEIADGQFGRILALFDFQDLSDLRYPPGSSTIDVYLNRIHPESVNWAYWAGFIITLRSSQISVSWLGYTV